METRNGDPFPLTFSSQVSCRLSLRTNPGMSLLLPYCRQFCLQRPHGLVLTFIWRNLVWCRTAVSCIVILDWLVVWNMNFMTFHILGIIIPTDELIFVRGVGIPPTSRCFQSQSQALLCLKLKRRKHPRVDGDVSHRFSSNVQFPQQGGYNMV